MCLFLISIAILNKVGVIENSNVAIHYILGCVFVYLFMFYLTLLILF